MKSMQIDEQGVYKIKGKKPTDHNTITVECELPKLDNKQKKRNNKKRLKINEKSNWAEYRRKLQDQELTKKVKRAEHKYEYLYNQMWNAAEESIGYRKPPKSSKIKTKEIQKAREQRKHAKALYEQTIPSGIEDEIEKTKKEYIENQTQVRELVEEYHTKKIQKTINSLMKGKGNDPNLLWKIKKAIEHNPIEGYTEIKDENGHRIQDQEKERERYAKYYEKLYTTRDPEPGMKTWVDHVQTMIKHYEVTDTNQTAAYNQRITSEELTTAINQLQTGKATGPDETPNEMIKYGGNELKNAILDTFNQIFTKENIPADWKHSNIISIYKGRGDREKMENMRGITLASNMEKLFERILNNRLIDNVTFTEGQAGGRKNRSTIHQLYLLKSMMRQAKEAKKKLYITFIDVEKAYDKTWQEIVLHILWRDGVRGKLWRLIKTLNKNLKARCIVKGEHSQEFQVTGSLRQGGVLSVTMFARMMDCLSEELIKENKGAYIAGIKIPSLLLVDDVALMANSRQEMKSMLEILEEFRKQHRLSLSAKKSKIMIVNKNKEDENTTWKIGGMKIDQVDTYTYLGEIIDRKCTMTPHLEDKRRKAMAITNQIINITKDEAYSKTRIHTALELYEKCLVTAVLYGSETWQLTTKEEKLLEDIQVESLNRILKMPRSSPRIAITGECGCLKMNDRVNQKKIVFIQKVRNQEENSWIKTVTEHQQKYNIQKSTTAGEWQTLKEKYEIPDTGPETENHNRFKHTVKEAVIKSANTRYAKDMKTGKKTAALAKFKNSITKENYLTTLYYTDARSILKARMRMTTLKGNFKGSHENHKCTLCNIEDETEEHIINRCENRDRTQIEGIKYEDILKNQLSPKKLTTNSQISPTSRRQNNNQRRSRIRYTTKTRMGEPQDNNTKGAAPI